MERFAICLLLTFAGSAVAGGSGANPIRKVVTLLQDMQKEVEAEGAKEKELFDKFMCFCTGNTAELQKNIDDGKAKVDDLTGQLKAETAQKAQFALDIVRHKEDKASAEADLAKAEAIRSKEQSEFEKESADATANIAAMNSAIPALEQGMGAASLVQMPGGVADRLKRLMEGPSYASDFDRQQVTAFLEQKSGQDYVPASGQIVGILKSMKDEMELSLKKITTDEETAVKGFGDLKGAKSEEIAMAAGAIKSKTSKVGELAVSVVQTSGAIDDAEDELADAQKFLASLMKACPGQEALFAEHAKTRAEEVSAISQAIDILNDDDALDVFKKAAPAALMQQDAKPSGAFLQQRQLSGVSALSRVQRLLEGVQQGRVHSKRMNLALYMMRSKLRLQARGMAAPSMGNITGMVDDMIVLEGEEQENDDHQKPWCNGEFDKEAREEKAEKTEMSSLESEMEQQSDAIAGLEEEIKTLTEGIAALDKTVAEATEQRKEEHTAYQETLTLTKTAIDLIGKAKNKLNKFYNPALHKGPPKKELSAEDKILANLGSAASFVQIVAHGGHRIAQPEMPAGLGGYEKKGQKSGGVMALMDSITKDLEASLSDIEHEEMTSQKDYVELMGDSQASRAQDLKSITDKEAAKAEITAKKVAAKEKEMGDLKDLEIIDRYVVELHGSCDFILENYDIRKEARVAEVESLKQAKAILSGATY